MPSKRKRSQPYNLDNPANWTNTKLKQELEGLGIKLTAAISKSALLQVYHQVNRAQNMHGNNKSSNIDMEIIPSDTLGDNVTNLQSEHSEDRTVTPEQQPIDNSPPLANNENMTNGALGMMTAMQNTMSSMQSTINKLLSDQARRSSTTATTNTLERFYGTQNSESIPIQTTRTQYGIPADELPHVDVVSDSVRKNIVEGKYVNLACLLIPEFEAPSVSVNEFSGIELLRQGRRDHRLDRILNITQFYKAFGIYKRVMCEAFPQRRPELDLYEADIGNIFEHYGEIFYAYHCKFTKKAAAYLEKGVKIDWSKRNKD